MGLVLLLVSAGGWLAHRTERAPAAPGAVSRTGSPAPDAPPSEPRRGLPSGAAAMPLADPAPMDPARARCFAAWQRIERERIAQLASEPEVNSQLAAALLDNEYTPDAAANEAANLRRHRRLQWALELAPQDPLVAAHAHRLCSSDDGCDASRTLDHLVRVDPDNAWTWIAVLEHAQEEGDAVGIEGALERIAGSTGARSYLGQTALRLIDGFGAPRLPGRCLVLLADSDEFGEPIAAADWADLSIGVEALASLPDLWPLVRACPVDLGDPHRRALCTSALKPLAAGETLLEQLIATVRLVQLTAGTPEGAAWRERYRNLCWLQSEARERQLGAHLSPLEWWQRGEVRFIEDRLRAQDAWPAPPGWLPESEEARSLVLTGRRPPPR